MLLLRSFEQWRRRLTQKPHFGATTQMLLCVCEAADGVKTPSTSEELRCEVDSPCCSAERGGEDREVGVAAPLDLLTLR